MNLRGSVLKLTIRDLEEDIYLRQEDYHLTYFFLLCSLKKLLKLFMINLEEDQLVIFAAATRFSFAVALPIDQRICEEVITDDGMAGQE